MRQLESIAGAHVTGRQSFARRTLSSSLLGALVLEVGCSGTIGYPVPNLQLYPCVLPSSLPTGSLTLTGTTYHAYGESITIGLLLPTPLDAYPYLIGQALGLTVSNNAVNGASACDLAPGQIFPHHDNPTAASNMLYTVMIGSNDAGRNIPGYTSVFDQCHQAAISWLATTAESKVLADAAGVTTFGGGDLENTSTWNDWITANQGTGINFPLTLATASPVYLWTIITDGDLGTFSYSVDGVVEGTGASKTSPAADSSQGNHITMSLIRIPSVLPGAHVITLTKTDVGGTMRIIGIGAPPPPGTALPNVLVSDIPYGLNPLTTASTGCSGTATPDLVYMAEIQKTVELLHGDGLNVTYVATRKYMFGTQAEIADEGGHPNALGDIELSHAFEASLIP